MGRRWLFAVLVAGAALVLGSCSEDATPEPIRVLAGMNDPDDATIAVTEYLPLQITVSAGTTVTWLLSGPEPHTVSFVPRGQPQEFGLDPLPPEGPYVGTTRISSGLEPRVDPVEFSVQFTEPGEYSYFCAIHARMKGIVTVVDGEGELQTEIDARGAEEAEQWLTEGRAAKVEFLAQDPESRALDDGSTEWRVEMGTQTDHTAIQAYSPEALDIEPGDKVIFLNNSQAPHTATFLAAQPPVPWWEGTEEPAVPDVPPGTAAEINTSEYANSGTLFAPFGKVSHSFVATEPGTYPYVCLIHLPSAMVGSLTASG